eukprot:scaffold634_cov185-Ochromonas_danica.AAC.7
MDQIVNFSALEEILESCRLEENWSGCQQNLHQYSTIFDIQQPYATSIHRELKSMKAYYWVIMAEVAFHHQYDLDNAIDCLRRAIVMDNGHPHIRPITARFILNVTEGLLSQEIEWIGQRYHQNMDVIHYDHSIERPTLPIILGDRYRELSPAAQLAIQRIVESLYPKEMDLFTMILASFPVEETLALSESFAIFAQEPSIPTMISMAILSATNQLLSNLFLDQYADQYACGRISKYGYWLQVDGIMTKAMLEYLLDDLLAAKVSLDHLINHLTINQLSTIPSNCRNSLILAAGQINLIVCTSQGLQAAKPFYEACLSIDGPWRTLLPFSVQAALVIDRAMTVLESSLAQREDSIVDEEALAEAYSCLHSFLGPWLESPEQIVDAMVQSESQLVSLSPPVGSGQYCLAGGPMDLLLKARQVSIGSMATLLATLIVFSYQHYRHHPQSGPSKNLPHGESSSSSSINQVQEGTKDEEIIPQPTVPQLEGNNGEQEIDNTVQSQQPNKPMEQSEEKPKEEHMEGESSQEDCIPHEEVLRIMEWAQKADKFPSAIVLWLLGNLNTYWGRLEKAVNILTICHETIMQMMITVCQTTRTTSSSSTTTSKGSNQQTVQNELLPIEQYWKLLQSLKGLAAPNSDGATGLASTIILYPHLPLCRLCDLYLAAYSPTAIPLVLLSDLLRSTQQALQQLLGLQSDSAIARHLYLGGGEVKLNDVMHATYPHPGLRDDHRLDEGLGNRYNITLDDLTANLVDLLPSWTKDLTRVDLLLPCLHLFTLLANLYHHYAMQPTLEDNLTFTYHYQSARWLAFTQVILNHYLSNDELLNTLSSVYVKELIEIKVRTMLYYSIVLAGLGLVNHAKKTVQEVLLNPVRNDSSEDGRRWALATTMLQRLLTNSNEVDSGSHSQRWNIAITLGMVLLQSGERKAAEGIAEELLEEIRHSLDPQRLSTPIPLLPHPPCTVSFITLPPLFPHQQQPAVVVSLLTSLAHILLTVRKYTLAKIALSLGWQFLHGISPEVADQLIQLPNLSKAEQIDLLRRTPTMKGWRLVEGTGWGVEMIHLATLQADLLCQTARLIQVEEDNLCDSRAMEIYTYAIGLCPLHSHARTALALIHYEKYRQYQLGLRQAKVLASVRSNKSPAVVAEGGNGIEEGKGDQLPSEVTSRYLATAHSYARSVLQQNERNAEAWHAYSLINEAMQLPSVALEAEKSSMVEEKLPMAICDDIFLWVEQ